MNKLILDFGNTLTKAAIFRDNELIHLESHQIFDVRQVRDLFRQFPEITYSVISSVVHHAESINDFLEQNTRLITLNETTPLPITSLYRDTGTLGKDRIAAAVAGSTFYPGKDVLIIMTGTCITYDLVDKMGQYHGGAISPGMEMRYRALNHFTDKLPLVSHGSPPDLTGNTTVSSIQSGVFNGMLAEIDGIIKQYKERYHSLTIILSGGDAKYFDKRLKNNIFAIPNIVVQGLNIILDFNAEIQDRN